MRILYLFLILFMTSVLFAGCSAFNVIERKYKALDFRETVSGQDAVVIAQHTLLFSSGKLHHRVNVSRPELISIDWKLPDYVYKKENFIGFYQRFEQYWGVAFPPRRVFFSDEKIGCIVWVDKIKGDARVECSLAGR